MFAGLRGSTVPASSKGEVPSGVGDLWPSMGRMEAEPGESRHRRRRKWQSAGRCTATGARRLVRLWAERAALGRTVGGAHAAYRFGLPHLHAPGFWLSYWAE